MYYISHILWKWQSMCRMHNITSFQYLVELNQGSQFRIRDCTSLINETIYFGIGQYWCIDLGLPLFIYIYICMYVCMYVCIP